MNRTLAAVALVAAFACSLAAQATRSVPLIAVRAGRLIDVAKREVRTNAVIVIEAGRVRSIDTAPPAGAQVIDLSQYSSPSKNERTENFFVKIEKLRSFGADPDRCSGGSRVAERPFRNPTTRP